MGQEEEGRRQIVLLRSQAAAAAAILLLAASPARADDYPPDVISVLAGESLPVDELTFVGVSGQLYFPSAETWLRKQVGGIASSVLGAVRSGDKIYAVSRRAPMFRLEGATWRATPLANRGRASFFAQGKTAMASLGRHIYRFDRGQWSRYATASRLVTAIYPAAKKRVYVATTRGRLRHTDGTTFRVIKNPLLTDDYVVRFAGQPGVELYGLSKSGVLLHVGATEAKAVTPEGALIGLQIQTMGTGPKGAILAAGLVPDEAGGTRAVLVSLSKGQAHLERPLWSLEPNDRFTVVHTAKGGPLVVASYGGDVGLLQEDGSWVRKKVSGAAPAAQLIHAGNGPARAP